MRAWADDLDRFYRAAEQDPALARQWLSTPRDQLPPDARAAADAYRAFTSDFSRGIKADLRSDGKLELTGGTHRAHYLVERGTNPIPVWVAHHDVHELARFKRDCEALVARSRPGMVDRAREAAPTARSPTGAPERCSDADGQIATRSVDKDVGRDGDRAATEVGRVAVRSAMNDQGQHPERRMGFERGEAARERGMPSPEQERSLFSLERDRSSSPERGR
jgi:hypothetical protein